MQWAAILALMKVVLYKQKESTIHTSLSKQAIFFISFTLSYKSSLNLS